MFFSTAIFVLILTFSVSRAEDIPCDCKVSNIAWEFFQFQSTCTVKSQFKVVSENTTITSLNGYTQPNVFARFFSVSDKVVYYIPKGLDVLFVKLTGLKFDQTNLKLVVKENLKPFPDLLMFSSSNNKIEFIERNLFMYNPKLQYVSFINDKITYIDPNVFEVIRLSLAVLYLDGTIIDCGLASASDPNGIRKLLNKIPNSVCANIENAPPLYPSWMRMKEEMENDDCEHEMAVKEEQCRIDIHNLQSLIRCLMDPSAPNCPS